MPSLFFFPGRLNPVLDGSPGDEDAVVAPQVPTGGPIGQAILGDQVDGQILDTAGAQALGQGQVGGVGGKEEVAVAAVMPGEGDHEVERAARARVTQIVQGALSDGVASGTAATVWATTGLIVAAAAFEARLGKVLDRGNIRTPRENRLSVMTNALVESIGFAEC
jgi:hypothetical protein